jgi:hypothetical protein
MPENQLTLSMLGGLESDISGLPVSGAAREKLLKSFTEAAAGEGLGAYDLGGRLLGFVGEALRKPLSGIMAEVWKQRREMREIAEKGGDKRDVEGKIDLYDHSITWAFHPSVELRANGVKLCTMPFDCDVDLALQGLQLLMKNGWITQIKAGKLTSTIKLEFKKVPLMPPCKKTIDLPHDLDLPNGGIRIVGDSRSPAGT